MDGMKILAVDGSPNMERGNTALLLERFLIGAIDAGGEVERVAAYAMHVQRCEARMKCWYAMPGVCIHNDDVSQMLDRIGTANVLVLSSPVHVGGMTEGMVRLMERMMPLLSPYFEVGDDGRTRHVLSPDVDDRKLVLISTCGYYEEEAFESIVCQAKDLSRSLGRRFAGALIRPHGLALKFMQAAGYDVDDVLQSAENAGRELVGEGELKESTLMAVRRPLMTQDEFVAMMNSAFDKRLGCQPGRTPGCG
ncbi:MAG: flavodoxin family protein [Chloroflexota bacterium]